jgi:hypothetical protein
VVETSSAPPSGERSTLVTNAKRLLGRDVVDEVEIERVRSHALQRIAAMNDPDARRVAEGPDGTNDPTEDDGAVAGATADTGPGPAEGAMDVIDVHDTGTEVIEDVEAPPLTADVAGGRAAEGAAVAPVVAEPAVTSDAGADGLDGGQDARPTAAHVDSSVDGDGGASQVELFTPETMPTSSDVDGSATTPGLADASAEPAEAVSATTSLRHDGAERTAVAAYPAYCPYCATILDPPPSATRRCGQCRQKIVVRSLDGRTVFLAEAALPVFEAERRRAAEAERLGRLRDKWLELALRAGAPLERARRLAEEPASENRLAAARALYISAIDRSFEAAIRADKLEEAARIRFDQAVVLYGFAGAPPPMAAESGIES